MPRLDWQNAAACKAADPELFFPVSEKGKAERDVARARAVCDSCLVRKQCLDYAMATAEANGIWGGLTEEERGQLRTRRLRKAG
ncbi:MAG TPA: WhiB family transcriptional regulator [Streptosporangiaceae bacterium]|nr:WhiB family transcriptional regulator [Streptosporangiaceae bacterium]